ncbi:helix-turn-helix domain-containing protein [Runella limosa]|uniref:helix-turn-helix domain-containing protein n=1 Tax=Runella limosa TaxID=370978 RepID=UPI0006850DDF|nr:helix-turn-helix transcriptional regulator [Runella limosa]
MTQFGKNLNRLLTEKKISQKELAELVGVRQSTVSDWLTKGAKPRKDEILQKLASVLQVTVAQLFEEQIKKEGVVYRGEEVIMSKKLYEAREAEIEYLRKIITLQNDNAKLKNIEDVSVKTQLDTTH